MRSLIFIGSSLLACVAPGPTSREIGHYRTSSAASQGDTFPAEGRVAQEDTTTSASTLLVAVVAAGFFVRSSPRRSQRTLTFLAMLPGMRW
jgi:hypothetical protein